MFYLFKNELKFENFMSDKEKDTLICFQFPRIEILLLGKYSGKEVTFC